MKKWIVLLIAMMTTGLIFWSCSDDDGSTEPSNDPPTCSITSPSDNATFTIGDSIMVDVDANDPDGNIFEVRFYFDSVGVYSDDDFPYSCIISTKSYDPGTYTVKAIAEDTDGAEKSSQININLTTVENTTPEITSFTVSATSVQQCGTVNLSCSATDADTGDVLTYTWTKTGGTLTSTTGTNTVWTAPTTVGTYTVTVTVSDGEDSVSDSKTITVTDSPDPGGMVFVQGGTFTMGDHFNEGNSDELPTHSVTVSDFYMGATEVTNQQYCDMLNYALSNILVTASTTTVTNSSGNSQELLDLDGVGCEISYNGSYFVVDTGLENHPVLKVTWYGSAFYCNMESRQAGMTELYDLTDWSCNFAGSGYRLPTEAEWEYAARGGIHNADNLRYSGCHEETDLINYAWYSANSGSTSHPVGEKLPNQLGLYDMSGNLWEWCWDWYGSYTSDAQTNPTGPTTGTYRVVRGGSWYTTAYYCRVTDHGNYPPYYSSFGVIGFRLSRTP